MALFFAVLDWLLILTALCFILTVGWVAVQILSLKRTVVARSKRVVERPAMTVTGLRNTFVGLADRETRRFERVKSLVQSTAGGVIGVVNETREAVQTLPIDDLKSFLRSLAHLANVAAAAARAADESA